MKKINILSGVSMALILAALLVAYFAFVNNTHVIALHFDAIRGIDYFGTRLDVFGILLVALVFNFVNIALAKFLYPRDNFLALILAFANTVFMILILITVVIVASNN